jgi:lipopolysaccharide export system protein LptA
MKAKIFSFTVLMILLLVHTTTAFAAKAPIIKADQQYFDINTGYYMLNGNVYIEFGSRIITAGQAKVSLASREVWATNGITVTQDDTYFTGSTVYVNGSQNRATIEGNILFSRTNIKLTANQVTYSWEDKIAFFTGNVQVTQNNATYTVDNLKYNLQTDTIL